MPPSPTKQLPPRNSSNANVKTLSDNVLDDIMPVANIASDYIKITIYGRNRVGKTHLACTFPKPLLLISFEPAINGGAETVQNVEGVYFIQPRSLKRAMTLVSKLKENNPYQTVVIDTATSFQDVILAELMGRSEIPEQLDWGTVTTDQYRQRSEKIKEALRPFLSLRCHTVVLAKEKDHNPPKMDKVNPKTGAIQPDMRPSFIRGVNDGSWVSCDLGGAAVEWLQDASDNVCQLFIQEEVIAREERATVMGQEKVRVVYEETGKKIRRLRAIHHPNYAAGLRSATPDRVPEFIDNPTYEKLLKVIKGE